MLKDRENGTDWREKIIALLQMKLRFATSSAVATAVDYGLYIGGLAMGFRPALANLLSATVGMLVNFMLQKRFVFDLQRKVGIAFLMAMSVSIGGILLSTGIVWILTSFTFLRDFPILAKIAATGMVFFYNFYLKRFVFEKRFF